MRTFRQITGLATALLLAAAAAHAQPTPQVTTRDGQPSVYTVRSRDAAMDSVYARARATLPVFERYLPRAQRGEVVAQLKARFSEGDVGEHMWIRDVRRVGERYRGILDNVPTAVRLARGDTVTVDAASVSDWMVVQDGALIGGFTLVEMRRRLTPKQRAQYDRESYYRTPADSAVWNLPPR